MNVHASSRALTRIAVLTASAGLLTAGLLTAGLLTGPASAAERSAGRPDTLAACAYYNGSALTVYGQRGDRVSQVQCLLANRRYLRWGEVTGYFGPKTLAAVKKFQSRQHLTANGKVDKKTWQALYYA
ncbi:peptidoglycan-binding domain-containing protein [Streptomyces kronopolitis]|uniref:peptidoglycan-binding domain-containing protein n=1 Tax=Streptomyces kronopolitis TaxID=1612435 RepID=UPI0036BB2CB9